MDQYIGLTPFLYLYDTAGDRFFQDGMFHRNKQEILEKLRMDSGGGNVIYCLCWAASGKEAAFLCMKEMSEHWRQICYKDCYFDNFRIK